jgi:hypothetical protein
MQKLFFNYRILSERIDFYSSWIQCRRNWLRLQSTWFCRVWFKLHLKLQYFNTYLKLNVIVSTSYLIQLLRCVITLDMNAINLEGNVLVNQMWSVANVRVVNQDFSDSRTVSNVIVLQLPHAMKRQVIDW